MVVTQTKRVLVTVGGERLGGNAGKGRTGCCRRVVWTEGVRAYNWVGGSWSSFHLERRGSNWESSSEEKREEGNHLVTLPRRDG